MINNWSCHVNQLSDLESKNSVAYFGRIIGFTEIDSKFGLPGGRYSGSSEWFAIAENEIFGTDIFGNPDWESLSCKFVLIPTSALLNIPRLE